MPSTVQASDGTAYHLWQLPDLTTPEPSESWTFTEFTNDLSDGYRSRRLVGSDTGVKSWKLKAPTLAGLSVMPNTVTSIDNAQVARLDYILSLYAESKVSGTPFVFTSPVNGQYYLVEFVGTDLTLDRVKATIQLYSTGIELKQVRLPGKTVFNPSLMSNISTAHWYNETSHGGSTTWNDKKVSGPLNFTKTGDVVFNANPQNGHNTVRLSGTTFNGGLTASSFDVCDAVFVFKVREATFGTLESILYPLISSPPPVGLLEGNSGTALMTAGLTSARVNGVSQASMSAITGPMNAFKIVHLSSAPSGQSYSTYFGTIIEWGLGYRSSVSTNFSKIDAGELFAWPTPQPTMLIRELVEHLTVKWGIL